MIVGDITEEKDRHPAILVNNIVDAFHELSEIVPLVIVEGNHDYKEEGAAFFEFMKRIPRIRWVNEPTMMNWKPKTLLLPHTNNWQKAWKQIQFDDADMILAHQTFAGSDAGFKKLDGIPIKTMQGVMTFSGDIHVPQEIGDDFAYIGAPYTVDFGDEYEPRLIWVENNPRNYVSVDVSMYPQKRAITVDLSHDDVRHATFNKGDVVQIRVELDDMGQWHSIKKRIEEDATSRGMKIWSIVPKLIAKRQRRQHRVQDQGSDRDILTSFAKRHGLDDRTIKTGRRLL